MAWIFSTPAPSYFEDKEKLSKSQQMKVTQREQEIMAGKIFGKREEKRYRYNIPPHAGNEIIGWVEAEPEGITPGRIQFIRIQIQVWY